MAAQPVAEITVDPATALVAEQGWQSWSPSTVYGLGDAPYRAVSERTQALCYRPGPIPSATPFCSDGLMAVQEHAGGRVHVIAAVDPLSAVPTITAAVEGAIITVQADGDVECHTDDGPDGIDGAFARWADRITATAGLTAPTPAPSVWCSWYHYFTQVSQDDIEENLAAIRELDLPVDVVQIDDGYQSDIGDWAVPSARFDSVPATFERIHQAGFRSGVWTAPFIVGERSAVFQEHPERLLRDGDGNPVPACWNWDQTLYAVDTTHPSTQEWLHEVFTWFREMGLSYHKIDFVYAAAMDGTRHEDVSGIEAYRRGVELVRAAIGPDSYLLGCGAPQLPSVGLVDAMRVSPDIAPHYRPTDGDMSQPSVLSAAVTGRARAFIQGRWWINDADCLIVRPEVERRHDWAAHVEAFSGLRASSDRIRSLDEWGMATTRRVLSSSPAEPFIPS